MRNGQWARSNIDIANTFAEHLADVFQPFPRDVSILPSDDISIQNNIPQSVNDIQPITPVTLNQVTDIIWSLNTKKSPDYDLITAKVVKELQRIGIKFVQCSVKTSSLPSPRESSSSEPYSKTSKTSTICVFL